MISLYNSPKDQTKYLNNISLIYLFMTDINEEYVSLHPPQIDYFVVLFDGDPEIID